MNNSLDEQDDEQDEGPQQHAERLEIVRVAISDDGCRALYSATRAAVNAAHVGCQLVQQRVLRIGLAGKRGGDRLH